MAWKPDMLRTSAREIAALAALSEQLQQWPAFAVTRREAPRMPGKLKERTARDRDELRSSDLCRSTPQIAKDAPTEERTDGAKVAH